MILKALKEKSNQKYINKLLTTRKVAVNNKKVTALGVLLNVSEFDDYEAFRNCFKALGFTSPKSRIITFSKDEDTNHNHWDALVTPKDFGWKGKINNTDLQTFLDTDFDALICYYKENHQELNQLALMSRANFKIGISVEDQSFYDLIIDVQPKEFEIFKTELKKYLTILNKI